MNINRAVYCSDVRTVDVRTVDVWTVDVRTVDVRPVDVRTVDVQTVAVCDSRANIAACRMSRLELCERLVLF
jgi:hypothetical protein